MENTRLPDQTDPAVTRALINKACVDNGCPEIGQRMIAKYNQRLTNCLGRARYKSEYDMSVEFSGPLWKRANQQERIETIVHEACHNIAIYLSNKNGTVLGRNGWARIKPHGIEWKRAMLRAGYQPERCHKVDTTGLRRTRKPAKRHAYVCACTTHSISTVRHNRMLKGRKYICNRCNETIRKSQVVSGLSMAG